jgi:predicted alternative tryptophan synthase beta-subunit
MPVVNDAGRPAIPALTGTFPLFPAALIGQEVSGERHIAIPDEVLDVYRRRRPAPTPTTSAAYANYLSGEIRDLAVSDRDIEEALAGLPARA